MKEFLKKYEGATLEFTFLEKNGFKVVKILTATWKGVSYEIKVNIHNWANDEEMIAAMDRYIHLEVRKNGKTPESLQ